MHKINTQYKYNRNFYHFIYLYKNLEICKLDFPNKFSFATPQSFQWPVNSCYIYLFYLSIKEFRSYVLLFPYQIKDAKKKKKSAQVLNILFGHLGISINLYIKILKYAILDFQIISSEWWHSPKLLNGR